MISACRMRLGTHQRERTHACRTRLGLIFVYQVIQSAEQAVVLVAKICHHSPITAQRAIEHVEK